MLELIAMWGGVAGCALAVVAILAILLVKADIKHVLNRDKILFDQNFALKKEVIDEALLIADELDINGEVVITNSAFQTRAKKCYNDLLCVASNMKLAEEFYSLAIENLTPVTQIRIAKFKVSCRKDIGLSLKGSKIVLRAQAKTKSGITASETIAPAQQMYSQPVQPMQPSQPVQPAQPVQRPTTQPMQRPVAPAQPVRPAVRPAPQARPVSQTQPVQRPTATRKPE